MLRGVYSIWILSGVIFACKMSMICKVDSCFRKRTGMKCCDLDAAERLMKCDTCFVKVYGNSFQRLKALQKDGMGHMVLFVRLHLLQVNLGDYEWESESKVEFSRRLLLIMPVEK